MCACAHSPSPARVCVCVHACVCPCARASVSARAYVCARACVHAFVRAYVCVRVRCIFPSAVLYQPLSRYSNLPFIAGWVACPDFMSIRTFTPRTNTPGNSPQRRWQRTFTPKGHLPPKDIYPQRTFTRKGHLPPGCPGQVNVRG